MRTSQRIISALCIAMAVSGCVVASESSEPAPQAFTNCVRHFSDDQLTSRDWAAAMEVCEPFLDEGNEALRRLAKKHFPD